MSCIGGVAGGQHRVEEVPQVGPLGLGQPVDAGARRGLDRSVDDEDILVEDAAGPEERVGTTGRAISLPSS